MNEGGTTSTLCIDETQQSPRSTMEVDIYGFHHRSSAVGQSRRDPYRHR